MSMYTCKICGKKFERVGNSVYCPGPHYRPCPICGKPVEYRRPTDPYKCCSKECSKLKTAQSKQSTVKYCEECGKEFHPVQATQRFCQGPHVSNCVACGKQFEYTCRPTEKPQTCSSKCQEVLKQQTNLDKYGVANVAQVDDVRAKISKANRSEDVVQQRIATNQRRYAVDNVSQNNIVRIKIAEKQRDKEFQAHRYDNYKALTGYESPMHNPDVVNKGRMSRLETYQSKGFLHSVEHIQHMMIDGSKIDEYMSFRNDAATYIKSHFDHTPTISELQDILGVTNTSIYNILISQNCRDLLSSGVSSIEDEVVSYIHSLDPTTVIKQRDRTIIKPLEIDIFLPEYKLGIECNPVSTHNSSFPDPWGKFPKPRSYHMNKSKLAADAGVFLFHIFGYEWNNHRDIIKSMLRNLMSKNIDKYGARETYIDVISYTECRQFLNSNHRQGNVSASIRLGLRLKATDELVSVMTFGKMRPSIGRKVSDTCTWELSRFCNKLNTTVQGSASKLLKYFINNYRPDKIVSFSDVAHTRGSLYSTLGFTSVSQTDPSYVWVDKYDNIYYHRVCCQKRNLRKLLNDPNIDIEHSTESQIMTAHRFARVFDCGVIRWELNLV